MEESKFSQIRNCIETVGGLHAFGQVFAAVMEKQVQRGGWAIPPDEFFSAANEETINLYRQKQSELNLWFFRENMKDLKKNDVALIISLFPEVDLSQETYAELVAACNDPGNRYRQEAENTKQEALKVLNRSLYGDLK